MIDYVMNECLHKIFPTFIHLLFGFFSLEINSNKQSIQEIADLTCPVHVSSYTHNIV